MHERKPTTRINEGHTPHSPPPTHTHTLTPAHTTPHQTRQRTGLPRPSAKRKNVRRDNLWHVQHLYPRAPLPRLCQYWPRLPPLTRSAPHLWIRCGISALFNKTALPVELTAIIEPRLLAIDPKRKDLWVRGLGQGAGSGSGSARGRVSELQRVRS